MSATGDAEWRCAAGPWALRDRHIAMIAHHGRISCQRRSGYNRKSPVETAVYRYKTIIGRRLCARNLLNQRTEAKIGCNALNRMTSLGMLGLRSEEVTGGTKMKARIAVHSRTNALRDRCHYPLFAKPIDGKYSLSVISANDYDAAAGRVVLQGGEPIRPAALATAMTSREAGTSSSDASRSIRT